MCLKRVPTPALAWNPLLILRWRVSSITQLQCHLLLHRLHPGDFRSQVFQLSPQRRLRPALRGPDTVRTGWGSRVSDHRPEQGIGRSRLCSNTILGRQRCFHLPHAAGQLRLAFGDLLPGITGHGVVGPNKARLSPSDDYARQ